MATPRNKIVSLGLTSYYHCTSRCVRGGYLCGKDNLTGRDYSHRRRWLRQRLLYLADVFAVKLAAFTIMENHFHVVLRIDKQSADSWTELEVVNRWHKIFKGNDLSQRLVNGSILTKGEQERLLKKIQVWRLALYDISWFMRCAKERLARLSNKEDNCKGRFWEGRFHSQALLDSKAVIACMAYVDLNPIRAKICVMPEQDPYSSIYYRAKSVREGINHNDALPSGLIRLCNKNHTLSGNSLAIDQLDYLALVDASARQIKPGKKGYLSDTALPILQRIGISHDNWEQLGDAFGTKFYSLVGCKKSLDTACNLLKQKFTWGQRACHSFFNQMRTDPKSALPPITSAYQEATPQK